MKNVQIVDRVAQVEPGGYGIQPDRAGKQPAEGAIRAGTLADAAEPIQKPAGPFTTGIETKKGKNEDRNFVDQDERFFLLLIERPDQPFSQQLPFGLGLPGEFHGERAK